RSAPWPRSRPYRGMSQARSRARSRHPSARRSVPCAGSVAREAERRETLLEIVGEQRNADQIVVGIAQVALLGGANGLVPFRDVELAASDPGECDQGRLLVLVHLGD